MVAVDFTGSNGNAKSHLSLHYVDKTNVENPKRNQYEQAIEAVGSIIEDYDTDHLYPVYGFGAEVKDESSPNGFKKSKCFPLRPNGEPAHMVSGILEVRSFICVMCV
jgi:hypothetical protein